MYLHTRLLFGIGTVTLIALAISVLVPVASVRSDVSRETDASMQLAQLLLDVHSAVLSARTAAEARAAATDEIRRARDLRHVRVSLVDDAGTLLATSPAEAPVSSGLTRLLLSASRPSTLTYPVAYHAVPLGQLRVSSNPFSEFAEIEQRVGSDLAQLTLAILAMGGAIYFMVRQGLRPVAQIQAALARLQGGNFETRLPRFRLRDIDDISARFNQCAAAMQEAEVQRRHLNRRIIQAEEEERRRLARELHDELGQSLTAIKVDAAYIAREAAGLSGKIAGSAHGIERLTGQIMELIRSMLARLRPHGLETVGLRETLQDLVSGWQVRVADRFQCTLTVDGDVDALAADLSVTVYRLIQECLTNAVRHSRARRIGIRLSVGEPPHGSGGGISRIPSPLVSIDVRESEVVPGGASIGPHGAGLLGMRERVEAHGGELTVDIDTTGGLSLHAWMPIAAADAESAHA
ncbi:MAG TPA: histidine kinase [Steroidobacteraceae bacterium]|nr:histidine kinase [Steroidobacteraceae bacterium]